MAIHNSMTSTEEIEMQLVVGVAAIATATDNDDDDWSKAWDNLSIDSHETQLLVVDNAVTVTAADDASVESDWDKDLDNLSIDSLPPQPRSLKKRKIACEQQQQQQQQPTNSAIAISTIVSTTAPIDKLCIDRELGNSGNGSQQEQEQAKQDDGDGGGDNDKSSHDLYYDASFPTTTLRLERQATKRTTATGKTIGDNDGGGDDDDDGDDENDTIVPTTPGKGCAMTEILTETIDSSNNSNSNTILLSSATTSTGIRIDKNGNERSLSSSSIDSINNSKDISNTATTTTTATNNIESSPNTSMPSPSFVSSHAVIAQIDVAAATGSRSSSANVAGTNTNINDNKNEDLQKYAVKLEEQVRECIILKKEKEQFQQRVCMLKSQSEHNKTMSRDSQALVRDKYAELMFIRREKEQLQQRVHMYENKNEESARALEQCKDAFKQKFETMETQFDKLKEKLDQSRCKIIELEERNGLIQGQLVRGKTNVQELTKQLDQSRLENEDQEKRNVILEQQMRTMPTHIKEPKGKIVELEERNDVVTRFYYNVLKGQMETMQIKYDESKRELELSKQVLRKFRTRKHKYKNKNKRNVILSKEIDDLKNKNNKLEKNLHFLESQQIEYKMKLDGEVVTLEMQLQELELLVNEKEKECNEITLERDGFEKAWSSKGRLIESMTEIVKSPYEKNCCAEVNEDCFDKLKVWTTTSQEQDQDQAKQKMIENTNYHTNSHRTNNDTTSSNNNSTTTMKSILSTKLTDFLTSDNSDDDDNDDDDNESKKELISRLNSSTPSQSATAIPLSSSSVPSSSTVPSLRQPSAIVGFCDSDSNDDIKKQHKQYQTALLSTATDPTVLNPVQLRLAAYNASAIVPGKKKKKKKEKKEKEKKHIKSKNNNPRCTQPPTTVTAMNSS